MTPSPARINVGQHKDVTVVEFMDNKILDEMNIAQIEESLGALISEKDRPKLLLDFRNVDHLSSAALGTLINVNSRLKKLNGQLRLAEIKPQIMEVFTITKLNRLFRICQTRPEALGTFE